MSGKLPIALPFVLSLLVADADAEKAMPLTLTTIFLGCKPSHGVRSSVFTWLTRWYHSELDVLYLLLTA